jgi:ABC-type multidrug transport system permease subunit
VMGSLKFGVGLSFLLGAISFIFCDLNVINLIHGNLTMLAMMSIATSICYGLGFLAWFVYWVGCKICQKMI